MEGDIPLNRRPARGRGRRPAHEASSAVDPVDYFTATADRAQRFFTHLLDRTGLGLVITEDGQKILYVNRAFEKMLGYPRGGLEGATVDQITHPDDRGVTRQVRQSVGLGKVNARRVEKRYLRHDGSVVWCALTFTSFAASDRARRVTVVQIEDISRHKRAEMALRRSEEQFRRYFEDASIGMAILDQFGEITRANQALAKFLRRARRRLVGEPLDRFVHEGDQDAYRKAHRRVLRGRGRGRTSIEARFETDKGGEAWGAISFAVLRDDDGRPLQTIVHLQDVTTRKRAEMALHDSEERFRRIFEDSAIGMHIADTAGNVVLVNRALGRMLGHPVAKLRRMTLRDLVHPGDWKDVSSTRRRMIAEGRKDADVLEVRYVRADGSVFWGALSRAPIVDSRGKVLFTVSQIQDITERKAAEELLRRHNDILARVAGGAPLNDVLALIAQSVEDVCPGVGCSIMRVDEDSGTLRMGAAPRLPKALSKQCDGMKIGPRSGPCGKAAHRGKPALVQDIETHPSTQDIKAAAKRAKFRACWSTPILSDADRVIGTFAVYLPESRPPSRAERAVVMSAAPIAGIAIERWRDTKALEERERRMQHYAQSAADTFWETDAEHRFVFVAETELNALEEEEQAKRLVGLTPWEWVDAGPDDESWSERRRTMERHEPFRDFRYVRDDGEGNLRYLRVNGTPFFDDDGKFRGYRGTTIDETAEVVARRREHTAENRFLNAMESLHEGFALWDASQRFVHCNTHYREINHEVEDLLVPGTDFAFFMRERARRGMVEVPGGDVDAWIDEFVRQHKTPGHTAHDSLINGRWYRVSKQSLDDGSTIVFHTDIHEIRQREAAIAESEAKYRALFERASDSIFMVDVETGRFVDANRRAAERLGYSREELLELTLYDISRDTTPAETKLVHDQIARDGFATFERTHTRKDGSTLNVEITSHVFALDGREVIQSFARDITQRKQAEAALRTSEARFRDFANAAADRFWETDEDHRLVYLTEPPEGSHLLPSKDLLGRVRWEDADRGRRIDSWDAYRRIVEAHQPFRDYRFSSTDAEGNVYYFKTSGTPLYDDDGNFRGYRGTTVDETAAVLEQQKVADIQRRFLAAMENIDEGVVLWGPDDRMVMCNSYFRHLHEPIAHLMRPGVSHAEVMRHVAESGIFDSIDDIDAFVASAASRHENESSEIERRAGNRWIRMRRQKLSDGSTLAFHTDITEAKSREEALRQAQKMEAVGQLTGGIAHDFNNLLAAILGNLEVLANDLALAPEKADRARRAINAVQRGAQLTNRLLAFSRKQTLEPEPTDMNAMLIGMLDLLQRSLGATISIHMHPATGLWPTLVDPAQLENAVLNLAINARDAMPGGGELTFTTGNAVIEESYRAAHPYAEPGEYVTLTVRDSGDGIPDEVMEHVFEPFFTTKGVGEGSGLGLSMVFGFVKQSQGHVEIDSEVGRGTAVTLYLPRSEVELLERPPQSAAGVEQVGRGERILVVEDDEDVLEITMTMLGGMGYRPLAARTGDEAAATVKANGGIALMLCDVNLPGGRSGIDLANEVALDAPDIKILLMSGYADRPAEDGPQPAKGSFPMLDKPFTLRALGETVQAMLNGGG